MFDHTDLKTAVNILKNCMDNDDLNNIREGFCLNVYIWDLYGIMKMERRQFVQTKLYKYFLNRNITNVIEMAETIIFSLKDDLNSGVKNV